MYELRRAQCSAPEKDGVLQGRAAWGNSVAEIKRVIALGFFDGVHIGHAALLNKTVERAAELGATPSVLSFDVHPDNLVFGGEVPLINSAMGREEVIRRCFGIDNVVFIHFNRHVMQMPWTEFIDSVIEELTVCGIVIGHDFSCGYKGEGTAGRISAYCAQRGVSCDVIPPVMLDGRVVSSTYIRSLISEGRMEEANRFLGHPHFLTDTVRSGYHLGTKLGTPTINMQFPDGVVSPRHGVYATMVFLEDGSRHKAVTNIGVRPTVAEDGGVSVESYLLDYSGNLYGRQARVEFYSFIRDEQKFDSLRELSRRISSDVESVRSYFDSLE